jgi:hypothetical protein
MRRIVVISVLFLVLVPAAAATTAPSLRLVTTTPLVVKGVNFHPGERVTVRVGTAKVVVRAGVAGTFSVNLGAPLVDRCSSGIVAAGARGDQAALFLRAMCAPASPTSPASPKAPLPVPA